MQKLVGELGLQDVQAAGVLGNIRHECMWFQSLQEVKPIRGGEGGWRWCRMDRPPAESLREVSD